MSFNLFTSMLDAVNGRNTYLRFFCLFAWVCLPIQYSAAADWQDYEVEVKLKSTDNDALGIMFRRVGAREVSAAVVAHRRR